MLNPYPVKIYRKDMRWILSERCWARYSQPRIIKWKNPTVSRLSNQPDYLNQFLTALVAIFCWNVTIYKILFQLPNNKINLYFTFTEIPRTWLHAGTACSALRKLGKRETSSFWNLVCISGTNWSEMAIWSMNHS